MNFTVPIGDKPSWLDFYRSPWFGTMRILLDGQLVAGRSPYSFGTHVSFQCLKKYEFIVGDREVVVEHERPSLFGGFRPHMYRVFVDGQVVHTEHGY